jgi:D-aminopeptidase
MTSRRVRAREAGIIIGELTTGPHNAITDVAGVRVGHTTLIDGEGKLQPGLGPVRTGVTVILPHAENIFRSKVGAAGHTINGFGKVLGFEQVRELGVLESPIALTNTLNVGLVADALVQYAIRQNPDIGITTSSVNVVVGETNDGYLNDLQGRHVRAAHVFAAIESASDGAVAEGAVGAGAGTMCFGWKGGIGTASRVLPIELGGFTLGALVQSNFGRASDLVIAGVPIGRSLQPPSHSRAPLAGIQQSHAQTALLNDMDARHASRHSGMTDDKGSIMIVLATDAPLDARQLHRLCVRAGAGLARVGSHYGHGSGDFVIGFSTVNRVEHEPIGLVGTHTIVIDEAKALAGLFRAAVEAVEEAIVNSLFCAETMTGRDDHVAWALPISEVLANLLTNSRRRDTPNDLIKT